jgi:hypothetical protein
MRTDPERMILKVYEGGRGGKIAQPSNEQANLYACNKVNDEAIREIHAKPSRRLKSWIEWLVVGAMAFAIGAMIGVQF